MYTKFKNVSWLDLCALGRSLTNELPSDFSGRADILFMGKDAARHGEMPDGVVAEVAVHRYHTEVADEILHQESDPDFRTWLAFSEPETGAFRWVSATSGARLSARRIDGGGWILTYRSPPYRKCGRSLYEDLFDDPSLGGGETGLGYRVAKGAFVVPARATGVKRVRRVPQVVLPADGSRPPGEYVEVRED